MRKLLAAIAPVLLGGALALITGALPAHAATPVTPALVVDVQITLPIHGGVAMDALNWGGTGQATGNCTEAVINDSIGVYNAAGAGCASHLDIVPLTGTNAAPDPFEILYAPNGAIPVTGSLGAAPNGYCVSTYANVPGTHYRLRGCSAVLTGTNAAPVATVTGVNPWQDFTEISGQFDSSAVLIGATGQTMYANDKGYGGDQSPVISWPVVAFHGANEGWTGA